MILSIGEILADLIGEKNDGALTFRAFAEARRSTLPLTQSKAARQSGSSGASGTT